MKLDNYYYYTIYSPPHCCLLGKDWLWFYFEIFTCVFYTLFSSLYCRALLFSEAKSYSRTLNSENPPILDQDPACLWLRNRGKNTPGYGLFGHFQKTPFQCVPLRATNSMYIVHCTIFLATLISVCYSGQSQGGYTNSEQAQTRVGNGSPSLR